MRLPDLTVDQIECPCAKFGVTKAQLIIIAIDRMAQHELENSPGARPEQDARSPNV